jgi:hypothetical protein
LNPLMGLLDFYFDRTRVLAFETHQGVGEFLWLPLTFLIALIGLTLVVGHLVPKLAKPVNVAAQWALVAVFSVFLVPELIIVTLLRRGEGAALPHAAYMYGDFVVWLEGIVGVVVAWLLARLKPSRGYWWIVFALVLAVLLVWNAGQCGPTVGEGCASPLETWWFGSVWPWLKEASDQPGV